MSSSQKIVYEGIMITHFERQGSPFCLWSQSSTPQSSERVLMVSIYLLVWSLVIHSSEMVLMVSILSGHWSSTPQKWFLWCQSTFLSLVTAPQKWFFWCQSTFLSLVTGHPHLRNGSYGVNLPLLSLVIHSLRNGSYGDNLSRRNVIFPTEVKAARS